MKNNILSTYIVSLMSMVTMLISFKVLSNILEYEVFLEYLKIIRYLNWFYVLLTLSLGFGIIYYIKQGVDKCIVFSSAMWVILVELMLALFFTTLISHEYLIFTLFIFGQIVFHIIVSYFRAIQDIKYANYLTIILKTVLILLVLFLVYILNIQSYHTYLLLIGTISLIILLVITYKNFSNYLVDLKKTKNIFSFSSSRWIENLLRMSYIVVILLCIDYMGTSKLAGEFALVFTVLKLIESVTQPVVMTLFSSSTKEKSEKFILNISILKYSFLSSILICIILYMFSELLLSLWFNSNFIYLSEYIFIISFAVFPVLSTVLIKGLYEEYFSISPMIFINLLMIVSIFLLHFMEINLFNITIFVVVSYWIRFVLFLIYLRFKNVYS